MKKIILIITGYALIYLAIEGTIYFTGDPLKTENALIVCLCTVIIAVLVDMLWFKKSFIKSLFWIGFGKPGLKSILIALLISALLFSCYPLISLATGYRFTMPDNWLWLFVGVFALHGIAEEIAFRGFLFHHLRENRSFIKAAWLSVLFFSIAHIPIILSQGILIGGTAAFLSIVISFPLAFLFEKGNNTIWAPAIIHFAVDTVIPVIAFDSSDHPGKQTAVLYWMILSMVIPYIVFAFFRRNPNN